MNYYKNKTMALNPIEKFFYEYASLNLDEKYALVSHAMLLNLPDSQKYIDKLKLAHVDIETLKSNKKFLIEGKFPFVKSKRDFTFIDLFAGIGGFRLAMQSLGGKCVFSSEIDESAKQTYFFNYGDVPFGDITDPKIKSLIPNTFDVLCAGFPCQPFSNAGLKRGIEDTRGTLFYHIADILKEHQPKAVLLENVRGLISNDSGKTIRTILKTITSMGYRCNIDEQIIQLGSDAQLKKECSKMVLSAKDYGVPQNRPRIYIVLWRKDLAVDEFRYPVPTNENTRLGDILESDVSDEFTISDRLWAGHQKRKIKNEKKGNGFGYCLFNDTSVYTSTLSRRYYKDGSEILIEQKGKNPRKLTPREASRLQGFPNNFILPVSKVKAYQQFGNSVAVPVVKAVSREIVKQILKV